MLTEPPVSSSILALVTTAHLAAAALRNHRHAVDRAISPLTFVSLAFALTPWLLPSAAGLAVGGGAHFFWFLVCEWLAPLATARPSQGVVTAGVEAAGAPATAKPAKAPSTFVAAPIIATVDETHDIKTIRFARPDFFEYEAGQFVTVRVRVDGKEHARCYSISSSPDVRGYVEISVKRQGVVSNALHATARPGGLLLIKRPNGRFTYPAGDDRPIVLLAGGVGITPLVSMLRHAVHTEPTRPVTLLYTVPTPRDLAFGDELVSIARRHPQVRVVFAVTREKVARPDVYPGRIDEALLRATVPNLAHSIAFICGPAAMIDAMKALLASLGVPPAQIRSEKFEAAIAASAAPSAREGAARATHQLQCSHAGRAVPIGTGETILDAAERGGVAVPSLCRAGVCGTCRIRVTSGDVDCTSTTLDDDERREGWVLACVATARSACTVEL